MLFHICSAAEWHQAQQQDMYHPTSLATEGFIHASTATQVVRTANRFYRGQQGLVLLEISELILTPHVRYEDADGDSFPHIYGPINVDAVTAVFLLAPAKDGTFQLPPGMMEAWKPAEK